RKTFLVFVAGKHLGAARSARLVAKADRRAGTGHVGATGPFFATGQRRWQKAFCRWPAAARGTGASGAWLRTACNLSGWYFRGTPQFLERRRLGHLRVISGRHVMAQQSGWQRTSAAQLSTSVRVSATLVPRRKTDRFLFRHLR